jgi:ppGpp synthetase/RelA/SpoT-type nucleotidyltranferase
MEKGLSTSQLNKLGERLRKGQPTDDDLRALDTFRLSFAAACEQVFRELSQLGLKPVSRPAKSTASIIAKLNRERSRLSKMQDIAGCRVEVDNMAEQDRMVNEIHAKFPHAVEHDRRQTPSHGYRAVHVVVNIQGFLVEIQVRTLLQHGWASAVETRADKIDLDIKYGGGPEGIQHELLNLSNTIAGLEETEKYLRDLHEQGHVSPDQTDSLEAEMRKFKTDLQAALARIILLGEEAEKPP